MKQKILKLFKPYTWQIKPFMDHNPVLLLTGSAGGGKSQLTANKIHFLMLKYPNSSGLILRKARETLKNSTMLLMQRSVIGDDNRVNFVESKNRFEYSNGSILAFGGMKDETQREAIRSIGQDGALDFVWMEEATAFIEEDFNEIKARMRGQSAGWRQIVLTTNPDKETHWINQRLILGNEAKVYYSSANDNPRLDNEYKRNLQSLTGVQKKRLCDGLWCQAEGVIYDMFSPEIHVIKKEQLLEIDRYKRLIIGADSNFPKPRSAVLIGEYGDGSYHIIEEFYHKNSQIENLMDWIVEIKSKTHHFISVYHDPSAPDHITKINSLQGVTCEKAYNPVIPGISIVAGLLKNNKLRICESCINWVSECQGYAWQKGSDEEKPIKEDDHLMDATRYGLASIGPKTNYVVGGFM